MKYRIVKAGSTYQVQRWIWYWPAWEILRDAYGVVALEFPSVKQAEAYVCKLHRPEIAVQFPLHQRVRGSEL